jgi:cell division initiation protein
MKPRCERRRLRQEIVRLEASLNQFRELEGSLKSTLMSAQKIADDMHENAAQESARIVREAEGRAELVLQKAQAKLEAMQRDIDGLRLKRREAETSIEATISTLHSTLDFVREQERREREVVLGQCGASVDLTRSRIKPVSTGRPFTAPSLRRPATIPRGRRSQPAPRP